MSRMFSAVLLALSLLTTPLTGVAAADTPFGNRPETIDLQDAYQLPSIFVEKMFVEKNGDTLRGWFTALSDAEELVGNLQYRIEIFGDLPGQPTDDPQVLFSASALQEVGSLVPGERKNVSFSIPAPALPEAMYSVRVQLLHGGTRELGWADERMQLRGADKTFTTIYGQSITLPEFDSKAVAALTGPNVQPGSEITLGLSAFNAHGVEHAVVPVVTLHRMDMGANEIDRITFDAQHMTASDSDMGLTITAPTEPGVYMAVATLLTDGKESSNVGLFRFIVRGTDADIISARPVAMKTQAGDEVFVRVEYVGPADAETVTSGTLTVTVKDDAGTVGESVASGIPLSDAIGMGLARITLTRDLTKNPVLITTISHRGTVLATDEVSLSLSDAQTAVMGTTTPWSVLASWYASPRAALSFALMLTVGALFFLALRRLTRIKRWMPALQHGLSIFMLVFLISAQFAPVFANGIEVAHPITVGDNVNNISGDKDAYRAYWSQIWSSPVIALFINKPIHNSTIDCRAAVPLQFRIEYAACNNIPAGGRIIARFDANGGMQSTLMGTNANWVKVYDETYYQAPDCGAAKACIHTKNYNTTINLNLPPKTVKTTLQVIAKHNAYIDAQHGIPDSTIDPNDIYFQRQFVQGFNLWLQCTPVCGNMVVENGEQCDDGNQNNNDACTNQCRTTFCGDGVIQNPNGNNQNEQCDDGNTNNGDGCSNICQLEKTDVTVTKTAQQTVNNDNAAEYYYQIVTRNLTNVPAANVRIQDTIPSNLEIIYVPPVCTRNGQTISCDLGTLAGNAEATRNIGVRAAARAFCGQTVTNTVNVTTTTQETNVNNNSSSAQTAFTCSAEKTDVTVVKTAPATLSNDDVSSYNYQIVTRNLTNVPAENVVVRDTIPSNLEITFVPSVCSQNGQTITCNLGTLGANAEATRNIGVRAAAKSVCSQAVSNTATVTTTTQETNVNNNSSTAVTNFTCTAPQKTDVTVVKTAPATLSNDTASNFTYQLTATNTSNVTAENVVMRDTVPSNLTIVTVGNDCTQNGQVVTCNVGSIQGGGSRTRNIAVRADAKTVCSQTVSNTVTVTTTTQETNVNNNSSTAVTNFTCTAPQKTDVTVVKTAPATLSNDSASAFNYTLMISNLSSVDAENVIVRDTVPSTLTITSVPTGCSQNGQVVTCQLGTLAGNASVQKVIGVSAAARSVCGQTVWNTATVTTSTQETNTGNNSSTADTSFTCTQQKTDVTVVKTAPATLSNDTDADVHYSLAITNTSNVAAENVTVTDIVPTQFSIVSVPAGCTQNNQAVTCALGTLAAGQTVTKSLVVRAAAKSVCSQTISNTANVTTTTQETNLNNNSSTAVTNFTCTQDNADLSIIKSGPASVQYGSNITYTITVQNLGPSSAHNVVVHDTIPTGLSYESASGATCFLALPSGGGNGFLSCDLGTMAAGTSKSFTLTFSTSIPQYCTQGSVTNTASVSSQTPDPVSSNNSSFATTTLSCPVQNTDLSIIKTGPATAKYGENVTYTLTVRNNGTIAATSVVIADTFPSEFTYEQSGSSSQCSLQSSNTVRCTLASLGAGQQTVFTLVFRTQATPSYCADRTVQNTGSVTSATPDTNSGNNTSSVTTTLQCQNGNVDQLTITKTDGRTTVYVQEHLRYIITVSNPLGTNVQNATVTDNVPYGLTILSASDGGAISGQQVMWSNQSFAAYQTRTYYIDVEVSSSLTDGTVLTNTATVAGKQATDQTTVIKIPTYNPPPYQPPQPPVYYPPVQPPVYYPPVQPPVYYPPQQPPVYYPPVQQPPIVVQPPVIQPPIIQQPPIVHTPPIYIYPETGAGDGELYASGDNQDQLQALADSSGTSPFSSIFYTTMLTLLAVGSAGATRFLAGSGMLLG